MKATEFIKMSLVSGKDWLISLIVDMKQAPLTQPTPNAHEASLRIPLVDRYPKLFSPKFPKVVEAQTLTIDFAG